MNWTAAEEKQLVETINRNIYQNSKRPIQWKAIKPMERHTIPGMQTRWAKYIQPNIHAKEEDHKEEVRNKAREGLSFVLLGRVKGYSL